MALDDSDRAELTDRLLESVELSTDPGYAAAWESEIKSRLEGIDAGRIKMIPAENVIQRLRAEAGTNGQAG